MLSSQSDRIFKIILSDNYNWSPSRDNCIIFTPKHHVFFLLFFPFYTVPIMYSSTLNLAFFSTFFIFLSFTSALPSPFFLPQWRLPPPSALQGRGGGVPVLYPKRVSPERRHCCISVCIYLRMLLHSVQLKSTEWVIILAPTCIGGRLFNLFSPKEV